MSNNHLLEVRFRSKGDQWQLRLCPDGAEREGLGWTPWNRPEPRRMKHELMESLFTDEQANLLLESAWDLRLRPEALGSNSGGIPEAPWDELMHPGKKVHIFEAGWTLTQVSRLPQAGITNGSVSVIGASGLAQGLARSLGPVVSETPVDRLRNQSVIVVGSRVTDDEATFIEERAWEQNCPFIIWCEFEPRRPTIPCAFKRGDLKPRLLEDWVRRLLVAVRRGVDPVRAFVETRLSLEERGLVSMRGAFKSWSVTDAATAFSLPPHWYISLDRSKQESHLNALAEGLLAEHGKRRIQVAITPGPVGAGLDLFRQRPLRSTGNYKLVEWEAGWADAPGSTIQWLQAQVHARDEMALPHRLQERAAAFPNGRALFLVRHSTASLAPNDATTQLTLGELQQYVKALDQLAGNLATSSLRMLFHISVLGTTSAELASLKKRGEYLLCDVLATLDSGVPADELEQWLIARDIPFDQPELATWVGYTYDELVQAIINRNPRLVQQ